MDRARALFLFLLSFSSFLFPFRPLALSLVTATRSNFGNNQILNLSPRGIPRCSRRSQITLAISSSRVLRRYRRDDSEFASRFIREREYSDDISSPKWPRRFWIPLINPLGDERRCATIIAECSSSSSVLRYVQHSRGVPFAKLLVFGTFVLKIGTCEFWREI